MAGEFDRLKGALAGVIRALRPVDYFALYPAKVVSQAPGGGPLDLQPDDARLPPLSSVPLRLGLPGAAVEVAAGARVLVGFEGGSPQRPVAVLWEASGLTKMRLGDVAGTQPAALGQVLQTFLNQLVTALSSLTLPVSGVTAGPPAPGTIPSAPTVTASKVEVV